MSFANKVFIDGEWIYNTPKWKENLEYLENDLKELDFTETNKRFLSDEVGLIHPTNGSYIRLKDDGTIEAFNSYGTGIRINNNNSIQLFADKVQSISKNFDVQTTANNKINHSVYENYPNEKGISLDTLTRLEQTGLNIYNGKEWKN